MALQQHRATVSYLSVPACSARMACPQEPLAGQPGRMTIQYPAGALAEDAPPRGRIALMTRRRSVPDPLAPIPYPTWLVVGDMLRNPLEVTKIEPHADIRAILNSAREAKTAEGWTCDEIGRCC